MLDLIQLRRDLHQIPERGFEELQTSDKLFGIISGLVGSRADIQVERERTAILVYVPGAEDGLTIGWRAEMDGLPIREKTELPFSSRLDGFMHACGHDLHMACALGILERILAQPTRNAFVFLFEPAEEGGGGAKAVYDAGLLSRFPIDEFYTLHVSPQWAPGVIAARSGSRFASSSEVVVEFTGVPGHAGMPHLTVDPIVAVSDFVQRIQGITGHNFDPAEGGVVLTFNTLRGGTMENAVAPSASVAGTLRVLHKEQHDLAYKRIHDVAEGVALASGTRAEVQVEDGTYLPVVDDDGVTARFLDYLRGRPEVTLEDAAATMASEDYGYLISRIPGMIFWLGVGGPNPLHSNRFAPEEGVIEPTVDVISDYLLQR